MRLKATASFSIEAWDEKTWEGAEGHEVEGRKLTDAKVTYRYEGEMAGVSEVHYVMSYDDDKSGSAAPQIEGHRPSYPFVLDYEG